MSLGQVDSFSSQVAGFVMRNKLLCVLTLGLAVVGYTLGKLGQRTVAWLKECFGTTKKADEVGRDTLQGVPAPALASSQRRAPSPVSVYSTRPPYSTAPPSYVTPAGEEERSDAEAAASQQLTLAPLPPSVQRVEEIMTSLDTPLPAVAETELRRMEARENVAHEVIPGLFLARTDLQSSDTFHQIFILTFFDQAGDYTPQPPPTSIEMDRRTRLEDFDINERTLIKFPLGTYQTVRLTLDCFRMENQRYLQMAIHHIDRTLVGEKNVLILGELGIHLSTTLVAAYIMSKYGVSPETAIHFIRSQRLYAQPDAKCLDFLRSEFRPVNLPKAGSADG